MLEGLNERYQIATSAFHCILSGNRNEAAYKTQIAGVMEIRTAHSSCHRPPPWSNFFSSHSILPSVFFIFQTTTGRFEKWGGRQFYTKYDLLAKGFLVSRRLIICKGGVVPYIVYMGMCGAKGYGFQPFWPEIGYQFRPFWSEIGCGLCTLVLNWTCFLEDIATSSSFGDKTISLLMVTPTTVSVP